MSDTEKPDDEAVVPIVTEPVFLEDSEPLPLPIFVSFACETAQDIDT